jgi:hypothetical protein
VDFHDRLLQRVNVAHEDGRPEAWAATATVVEDAGVRAELAAWLGEQLAEADLVVVKDPRLTWFVPLYRSTAEQLGAEVALVTMLRHPAESVKSRELAYGNRSRPLTRMAGWLNMMLGLENQSRDMPRALVTYEALMTDWRAALGAAERATGFPMVSAASDGQRADAASLVDASLRRARADWPDLGLPGAVEDLARRTYDAFSDLAGGDGTGAARALDGLRADYARLYDEAAELTRSRVRAARVEERRHARQQAMASPSGVPSSLRRVRSGLGRLRRRARAGLQRLSA